MTTNIEIVGLDRLIADFHRAGAEAQPVVTAALANSANKTQSEIRQRASHRTGTMQRGVMTKVSYPEAMVFETEKYGVFQEEGTRPIYPTSKKALRFTLKGGDVIFAKRTKGVPKHPFFKPGSEAAVPYIYAQFIKVIERLTRISGGHA